VAQLNPASVAVAAGTPYVTPPMLIAAPTGVVWETIGGGALPNDEQQFDEIINLCRRATSMVDGYANQPLRATLDTETLFGPGDLRFQMQPNGNARLLLSRSPVTQVLGGQISIANSFPAQWTPISAAYYKIEKPLIGLYGSSSPGGSDNSGQAVLLAPGFASWMAGRYGYQVTTAYINGWPHGCLTQAAAVGDMTVSIDDCCGWGPPPELVMQAGSSTTTMPQIPGQMLIPALTPTGMGAAGTIYDPGWQETFSTLAATATAGPGVLTLAAPLAYAHQVGTMISTLPNTIIQAAILYCVAQALIRGATATSIQATPGSMAAEKEPGHYAGEAELLIHPYKRVI
jgi:hypothetical protein